VKNKNSYYLINTIILSLFFWTTGVFFFTSMNNIFFPLTKAYYIASSVLNLCFLSAKGIFESFSIYNLPGHFENDFYDILFAAGFYDLVLIEDRLTVYSYTYLFNDIVLALPLVYLFIVSVFLLILAPFSSIDSTKGSNGLRISPFYWLTWNFMYALNFIWERFFWFPEFTNVFQTPGLHLYDGEFLLNSLADLVVSVELFFSAIELNQSILLLQAGILICGLVTSVLFYNEWLAHKENFYIHNLLTSVVVFLLVLVSSNDWLVLLIALEGVSAIFAIFIMKSKIYGSSEASLKYYILTSLTTGWSILGIVAISFYTGGLNFVFVEQAVIEMIESGNTNFPLIYYIWIFFISFIFKFGSWPFGFWIPDTYEGSSVAVAGLASILTKFGMWALFIRLVTNFFLLPFVSGYLTTLFLVLAIVSLAVGCTGALNQNSLNRFIGYTAINQTGFLFMAVGAGSWDCLNAVVIYLIFYFVAVSVFFLVISMYATRDFFSRDGGYRDLRYVSNLKNLATLSPVSIAVLGISLFSMAGVPPFAGFWAKFQLLVSVLNQTSSSDILFFTQHQGSSVLNIELLKIAFVVSVITSLVSAFYYIRLVVDAVSNFLVIRTRAPHLSGTVLWSGSSQLKLFNFVWSFNKLAKAADGSSNVFFKFAVNDSWVYYLIFSYLSMLLFVLSFWWLVPDIWTLVARSVL
jgi:NADH-quinone oxidoreductase subunit N